MKIKLFVTILIVLVLLVNVVPAAASVPSQDPSKISWVLSLPPAKPEFKQLQKTDVIIRQLKSTSCTSSAPCVNAKILPPRLSGSAPDGTVFPVGVFESVQNIIRTFRGDPGTFMMSGPKGQLLMAWSKGSSWLFTGMSESGAPLNSLAQYAGANKTDTWTFSSMIKSLESSGWRYVTKDQLPPHLITLLSNIGAYMLQAAAGRLTIIFVVPLTTFDAGKFFPGTISG